MGQIQQSINQLLGTAAVFKKLGGIEQAVSKLTPEEEEGLKRAEEFEEEYTANTKKYGHLPDLRPLADDGGIETPGFNRGDVGPYEQGFGEGSHQKFLAQQLDMKKAREGGAFITANTQDKINVLDENAKRIKMRFEMAKHKATATPMSIADSIMEKVKQQGGK
jgi:hypothetical protein